MLQPQGTSSRCEPPAAEPNDEQATTSSNRPPLFPCRPSNNNNNTCHIGRQQPRSALVEGQLGVVLAGRAAPHSCTVCGSDGRISQPQLPRNTHLMLRRSNSRVLRVLEYSSTGKQPQYLQTPGKTSSCCTTRELEYSRSQHLLAFAQQPLVNGETTQSNKPIRFVLKDVWHILLSVMCVTTLVK